MAIIFSDLYSQNCLKMFHIYLTISVYVLSFALDEELTHVYVSYIFVYIVMCRPL